MPKDRYRSENEGLIEKIKELEKRISALERTPRLSTAGINEGGITVKGGLIEVLRDDVREEGAIQLGSNVLYSGEAGMSISIQRSQTVPGGYTTVEGDPIDGNRSVSLATVEGNDPGFKYPTWVLSDKSGDVLISDSTNARHGFDHPRLHYTFTDGTYKTSTSGTFAFIMSCEWYMYHPHVRVRVLVQNDVGSASEIRFSENGGDPNIHTEVVPAGTFDYIDLVVPASSMSQFGANGNIAAINLEHRRSSGAGTIRTQVISVVGIDLSWFEPY